MNITIGKIDAISRPTEVAVSVRSALASAKRAVSYGSRTNARTTRMPVICSRSTRLTGRSGSASAGTAAASFESSGRSRWPAQASATATSQDRPTSSRRAMMMPPIMVIGAATNIVLLSSTSICTCCTSLVLRVISDGAPKWLSSREEKASTRSKIAPRTSRPKPIAVLAPR